MRNGQQDADGVVGEVIFPNTVPPFFPELRVVRARRRSPRSTSTGWRASARTTVGSKTSAVSYPERRAGIGQIFVNDIDDAIEDIKWIKEHNLRGGVLLPTVPPDATWLKPLQPPRLRPPLGRVRRPRASR